MPNLTHKIEAVLLFKNEPVSFKDLSKMLDVSLDDVRQAIKDLQSNYSDHGIVILTTDTEVSLGTHPDASSLIEKIQKEELSRELGRAGLETLSIILYKGPVSRREIDFIRGVNSGYIIRNLLIRGLIEKGDPPASTSEASRAGRSFSYKPTLEVLRYLGVTKREDLPEYGKAFGKIEEFVKNQSEDAHQ
ncbi:SMC-Scp complex subunit ScpB [Candidatus Parcubacteria bacterium]|nr:SMC-Scp complex subunit ScpB [Candidatus Parcubacteria bacterium]